MSGIPVAARNVDEGEGGRRSIYRHVNSGGSFGGNQGMFPLSVGNVRIPVRVVPTCTRGWSDAPRGGR